MTGKSIKTDEIHNQNRCKLLQKKDSQKLEMHLKKHKCKQYRNVTM